MFKKRELFHLSGRKHTRHGVVSTIIGIFVIVGFISISIISSTTHGKGGEILGLIGLILLAMSVYGFIMAYKAFQAKDIFYRFPIIGIVLNSIMVILLFILFILGLGGWYGSFRTADKFHSGSG